MRGAEAVVEKSRFIGRRVVVKTRIPKKYREKELDLVLRKKRTRAEAKLLHRAKLSGVLCPTVLSVSCFEIIMDFIEGKRPEMTPAQCMKAGEILSLLHQNDLIHGDFTPANLIKKGSRIWVIDFGLSFVSSDVEDKAVDVFTMLRSIKHRKSFLEGYSSYGESARVLKRERQVQSRVRYVDSEKRIR